MNPTKLFFRNLGHYIASPFVMLYLSFQIKKSKSKYLTYEAEGDEITAESRYSFVYGQIKAALFLANINIKYEGYSQLPKRPLFFVANHKSEFDILVLLNFFAKHKSLSFPIFVAKKEIEEEKKLAYNAKMIDTIFIDRENLREIMGVLTKQKEKLKTNSIVVFPEGTRIEKNEIEEFKSAAFEPAISTLTPIVPVCIHGLFGINKLKENLFKYKEITVKFLQPIKHVDYIKFSRDSISTKVQEKIKDEYEKLDKLYQEKNAHQKKSVNGQTHCDNNKDNPNLKEDTNHLDIDNDK